ncbi:MAG: hypothetical protein FJW88_08425 [Actinobacteria bacterium]|nr:hypothetical protein [Actinomycetota bacterium]
MGRFSSRRSRSWATKKQASVTALGLEVRHLQIGDHVVVSWIAPCRRCRLCLGGQIELCEHGIEPPLRRAVRNDRRRSGRVRARDRQLRRVAGRTRSRGRPDRSDLPERSRRPDRLCGRHRCRLCRRRRVRRHEGRRARAKPHRVRSVAPIATRPRNGPLAGRTLDRPPSCVRPTPRTTGSTSSNLTRTSEQEGLCPPSIRLPPRALHSPTPSPQKSCAARWRPCASRWRPTCRARRQPRS